MSFFLSFSFSRCGVSPRPFLTDLSNWDTFLSFFFFFFFFFFTFFFGLPQLAEHVRNDCTMVPTRCLRGCSARLVRGMLAAHAATCAAPIQQNNTTLRKTKSGRSASVVNVSALGDENSDTEEEDVAPVPRKSSSRRSSKQHQQQQQQSSDVDVNSTATSSTNDAATSELHSPNRTDSASPRSRVMGDDVVLLRPETTLEELQSQLEETILRVHVLKRQHASTEHAMLDDDFGASERAELRGVLNELTAELSRQTAKKKSLERRLKKSGVELHSPTMRIVDHGGLLELDDGVELDTSSDDANLYYEDDDDEDAEGPPHLRRARSSEDTRHMGGGGHGPNKSPLSASASSALKKKPNGTSLKERKNNQMSMSYIDRPTALPPVRRGERGTSAGSALSPKRPEGQAPKPPS
jgi:hypothetical protein